MNVEHNCLFAQADAVRIPLASDSCDLVIGSPPYLAARLYLESGKDLGIARECAAWVEWMMQVTREAIRVSRGLVLWVCAGPTQRRNYQPGPEGLVWAWHNRQIGSGVWQDGIELPGVGGYQECPCYWHRVGICGSGGDQWFRKDVEYVLAFKKTPVLSYSDNTACGHVPKWSPGGEMSHRLSDGTRRNQWGHSGTGETSTRAKDGSRQKAERPSHKVTTKKAMKGRNHEGGSLGVAHSKRAANGNMEVQSYRSPDLANPGNWLDIEDAPNVLEMFVGGGHLGSQWSHENEAPMPTRLSDHFIKSFTKPGDICLDPFSGSGTVCESASNLGRIGIGFDLRMSQCRIGQQRIERPHLAVLPSKKKDKPFLLLGETE